MWTWWALLYSVAGFLLGFYVRGLVNVAVQHRIRQSMPGVQKWWRKNYMQGILLIFVLASCVVLYQEHRADHRRDVCIAQALNAFRENSNEATNAANAQTNYLKSILKPGLTPVQKGMLTQEYVDAQNTLAQTRKKNAPIINKDCSPENSGR